MSGVPTPSPIVKAFGSSAVSITNPIPVASQIGVTPGAASFTDGFPPLTETPKTAGGVPPSGADMTGILYMISAYCAMLQAGQMPMFSSVVAAAIGGYVAGAKLSKATGIGTWTNVTTGNVTNPDTGGAGWYSSTTLQVAENPGAGTFNDVVLPGASDYFLDYNTSAGDVILTGFVAQRDGQRLTVSAIGANNVKLSALTGSVAANQLRLNSTVTLNPNASLTFQYSTAAAVWIQV